MLSLHPLAGSQNIWYEFHVSSSNDGESKTYCTGLIRIKNANVISKCSLISSLFVQSHGNTVSPEKDLDQLKYPTPYHLWYKTQTEVGYGFGPGFQRQLFVEVVARKRESRSIVSLTEPESAHSPQILYPMHPACIDGCFQTVTPSLWAGERFTIYAVPVPATIDNLMIYQKTAGVEEGVSLAKSEYTGRGRMEEAKSFFSSCSVFDQASGKIMLKMDGLRYHKLDIGSDMHDQHTYNRTISRPDITFLSQEQLYSLSCNDSSGGIRQLFDLIAHKKPAVKVLEASCVAGDTTSLWFSGEISPIRSAYAQYTYVSSDVRALMIAKENYEIMKRTSFDPIDLLTPGSSLSGTDYDLVMVKVSDLSEMIVTRVAQSVHTGLSDNAFVVFLEQEVVEPSTPASADDSDSSVVIVGKPELTHKISEYIINIYEDPAIVSSLGTCGYTNVIRLPQSSASKAYMAKFTAKSTGKATAKSVSVVHISGRYRLRHGLKTILEQSGWQVTEHFHHTLIYDLRVLFSFLMRRCLLCSVPYPRVNGMHFVESLCKEIEFCGLQKVLR